MAEGWSDFGERFGAITDGITSIEESFIDDDFFPNINNLYINDMADDANPNLNANPNLTPTPYELFSYLFWFLLQFLMLAFGMIWSIYLFRYDLYTCLDIIYIVLV
jgi:hypothetical protein